MRELYGKELIPVPRHALRQAGRIQYSQTIRLCFLFSTENLQIFIVVFLMTIAAKTNWLGLQKSTQDARQYWSREIQSDYLSQQKYIIPKKGADLGSFVHPGKVPQPHLDVGTKFPAHPYGPS